MTPVLNRELQLSCDPCDAGASKCCHRFVPGSKGGPVDDLTVGRLVGIWVGDDFSYVWGGLKGRNCLGSFLHFNLQQC